METGQKTGATNQMIKVHKSKDGNIYIVAKEDSERLEAILKRYNIKAPLHYGVLSPNIGQLLFWKEELEDIEKQYKLARKQEKERTSYGVRKTAKKKEQQK